MAGELLELALGADAGNLDLPDFQDLGVELDFLPGREKLRECISADVPIHALIHVGGD